MKTPRSNDCLRQLPLECGTNRSFSFRVMVGADSRVEKVVPTDASVTPKVLQVAKCLKEHTDQLDKLIARSKNAPPFEFEISTGHMWCDAELAEPVQ